VNGVSDKASMVNQGVRLNNQNGDTKSAITDLKDMFKGALDNIKGAAPQVNFNGQYSFSDKNDIDYFMNQAALLIDRRRS
jgi:hypothetical protein